MGWRQLVLGYFMITVAFIVIAVVTTETVELLIGKNERDLDRSGRWVRRVARLSDTLRGAWTMGLAWTFAVFLLVGVFDMYQTPTAADRWRLLQADGIMFVAWLLVVLVRIGVTARHASRIDMATRNSSR